MGLGEAEQPLAAEFPAGAERIYAHFIHTPASVARYASLVLGIPWSCSAHAKDIWTSPDWDLADKLASAEWTVTCTQAGCERLTRLAPAQKPVRLVYHGLDLGRFAPMRAPRCTMQPGPTTARSPISTASSMTASGPTVAEAAMQAPGETTALGSMPASALDSGCSSAAMRA